MNISTDYMFLFFYIFKTSCANGIVSNTIDKYKSNILTFVVFDNHFYENQIEKRNEPITVDGRKYTCNFITFNYEMVKNQHNTIIYIYLNLVPDFEKKDVYKIKIKIGLKERKFIVVAKSEYLPVDHETDIYITEFNKYANTFIGFVDKFIIEKKIVNFIVVEESKDGYFTVKMTVIKMLLKDDQTFYGSYFNENLVDNINYIICHKNGKISRGLKNKITTLQKYRNNKFNFKLHILNIAMIIFISVVFYSICRIFKWLCY